MGKIEFKNRYLKYIAIVLVFIFLITAALMFLEVWEKRKGVFPILNTDDGVVEYEGKKYIPKEDIETFLVLGIDKYKGANTSDSHETGSVQADFLMLFVFDNTAKQTTAIHINRDTIANVNQLDVAGNKIGTDKKQIALAYDFEYESNGNKSCRNVADSVSDLLKGIKVEHYISLTMESVAEINDLVGGVEVTVLDDFTGIDDTLIKGKKVNLTGEQAFRYVRSRYGLDDSTNNNRMLRQQQYIDALFDKTVSLLKADEEFAIKAIEKINPYLVYDSTNYRMQEYANKFDDYEFLGIKEPKGETKAGEKFVEFYPDEDSIWKIVIDLFYTEKANSRR